MSYKLCLDHFHVVNGHIPLADVFTGTKTCDYVNLASYGACIFVVHIGAATTGNSTITVQAASDNSGTGATPVQFRYRRVSDVTASDVPGAIIDATTAGFAYTAGANQIYEIEVLGQYLPAGKSFVALKFVEVTDSPVTASVLSILGNARYPSETPVTARA
jgi:hypothetical protein